MNLIHIFRRIQFRRTNYYISIPSFGKNIFLLGSIFVLFIAKTSAQQKLLQGQMNFISTPKPNSIIYHDSIYNGSRAFRSLFLQTKDAQIIEAYKFHQTDKIWGSILSTTGSIALSLGVVYASSYHPNISRGTGWIMAGSGMFAAITGGFLLNRAHSDLLIATYLFNKKKSKPTAIGISNNGLSVVVKL